MSPEPPMINKAKHYFGFWTEAELWQADYERFPENEWSDEEK